MGSSMNRQHLEAIRSDSCYPTFRGFVQVFTLLGYLGAAVFAAAGMMSGQVGAMLIAIAIGIIAALLVRMGKEVSLMLADIADTIIASSARAIAASTPDEATVPVATGPVTPTSDEDAMAAYGITFDGEKYQYQSYRYDRLSDAVAYARRNQGA